MSNQSYLCVEEFMTTDLFTVHEDEPLELVANLMDWKRVRHIPVENEQGQLAGLISCFEVLRHLLRASNATDRTPVAVGFVMNKTPLTITPETRTLDAIAFMRREKVDCLPVVNKGRLVGIVTERDFINVAARLLGARSRASEGKCCRLLTLGEVVTAVTTRRDPGHSPSCLEPL